MGPPPGLFAELARWRSKAQKRGTCTFTSDIIPEWLNAEVKAAMDTVGVADAFAFLKAEPETRTKQEKQLERQVQEVLDDFEVSVLEAVQEGQQPDYEALAQALTVVFIPLLATQFTTEALRVSAEVGIAFDVAVINTHAIEWARRYSFELVTGLTNTTRKLVQESVIGFLETPGMTQGDLQKLLEPAFGQVRAEMISITEVTRAVSGGTNEVQRLLREADVDMGRIWNTAQDDRVCPICGPLNGTPESVWRGQFPFGPPAHPRCRCSDSLSGASDKFHLGDAVDRSKERVEMFVMMGDEPGEKLAREELAKMRERFRNA